MKFTIRTRTNRYYITLCIVIVALFLLANFYPVLAINSDTHQDIPTPESSNIIIDASSRSTGRAEDWWKNRGDASNTGYSTSKATNVYNRLWKRTFDIESELYSSPVVANNKVYIGSLDRTIYATDIYTGSIVWSKSTTNLGGPLSGDEIVSSAAVANGILFIGCSDKNLFALDAETGTFLWNYTTGGPIQAAPAVADNKVFIGSFDKYLYALATTTGKVEWKFWTGYKIRSTPAIVGNMVFFGTESPAGAGDPCVYALDIQTGNEIWNFTTATGQGVSSSIAVGGNKLFFGALDSKVYALNRSTGAQLWNFTTGNSVYSSPALDVGNDVLYIGSDDNKLYALPMTDPDGDGKINSTEMYWSYETADKIHSSPAIADGKVFIGSYDKRFYALNATPQPLSTQHREIWENPLWTNGFIESSAAVANGIVFIASDSGSLWAIASTDLGIYNHEVKVYDLNPFATENVEIRATVYNNGSINLTGSLKFVDWDRSGNLRALQKILIEEHNFTLDVGEAITFTTDWVAVAGQHDIIAQINRSAPADSYDGNDFAAWILEPIPPLYSEGWSMFQNDTAHTGLSWLAPRTNKTEWTYKTGAAIKSSAAIAKDRVFLTSLDGNIYALNEKDGSDLWNYSVGAPIYTSPAFIASGGDNSKYDKIFIGADDGVVYGFDMNDGSILWSYTTGDKVRASAMVINGIVYIGSTDGKLYALDEDGSFDGDQGVDDNATTNEDLLWSRSIGSISASVPAALLAEDKLYVGTDEGKAYALNRFTGATIWVRDFGAGAALKSSPAIGDGLVYIGAGNSQFYALKTEDGSIDWSDTTGGIISSSPAIDTENNVAVVGCDDGNVYAYDATTGERLWVYNTGGIVRSAIVIADGRAFFGSEDMKVYALDEVGNGDGTTDLIWSFKADERILASPMISNNGLYIGSESGMLFRLGSPNVPPEAKITAPANQSVFFRDENITFNGTESTDLEDIELRYNWTSARVVQLPGELPKVLTNYIYDGYDPVITATLPEGDHLIILRVTDPMSGISNATTNITVFQPKTEYFLNSTIPADCTIYYGGKGTVEISATTNPGSITTGSIGLFDTFRFESLTPRYKIGWSNITISLKNANMPEGLNTSRLNMYSWDIVNRNWVKLPNSGLINLSADDLRVWAKADDLVTPQITVYSLGTYDNSPPELEIVGDSVYPLEGSDYDTFTYRVKYTDIDNDGPKPTLGGNIWVYINGIPYIMEETDTNDTDYTNSKEYQFQITGAEIGISTTNVHYFAAHDGTYQAIGDISGQNGPVVKLGTPVAEAGEDIWVEEDMVFKLDGSGSYDEDGSIAAYYWDMDADVDSDGDGIFDNDRDTEGETTSWRYSKTGEFIVTLTVIDDQDASAQDTLKVTVTPKEETGTIEDQAMFWSIIIVIIIIIILIIVLAVLRKRMKETKEYEKFKGRETLDEEEGEEGEDEEEDSEDEEDEFECPSCGAILGADDDVCPECGEEFEEDEEE